MNIRLPIPCWYMVAFNHIRIQYDTFSLILDIVKMTQIVKAVNTKKK